MGVRVEVEMIRFVVGACVVLFHGSTHGHGIARTRISERRLYT